MSSKKLIRVKAKHDYQRQNEDELAFQKGAIILVSKNEDGGWWEGTLNGNTGWFPSNFVREIKNTRIIDADSVSPPNLPDQEVIKAQETKLAYYQQVLQNLLETERTYVKELQNLVGMYIDPLQRQTTPGGEGIPASDILVLSGNIQDIIGFQQKFVRELEECTKIPYQQQQVSQCFEKNSDTFRSLYETYCGNHPSAVIIIQTHKEQITRQIESKTGQNSGVTQLTSGLSMPFRHLEGYSSSLREVERHLEESHPDKQHVLQAISDYERISLVCQETRRRKETIQHILSSPIQGWEGDSITNFGPVLYMSAVIFLSGPDDRKERYLLLFRHCLVMLSVSPRMSGFIYEGMLPLSALQPKRLDDTHNYQHAFEITGKLIDRKIVITRSTEEQRRWLQVLEEQCAQCHRSSLAPVAHHPSPIVKQVPVTQIPPTPKVVPGHMHKAIRKTPEPHPSPAVSPLLFSISKSGEKAHHVLSLRPAAPLRHVLGSKDASGGQDRSKSPKMTGKKRKKTNKQDRKTFVDEEAVPNVDQRTAAEESARLADEQEVLEVLKNYCNAMHMRNHACLAPGNKTRHTSILEEKIIVEDPENGGMIEEKSLVDTVYELKDQVATLIQEQRKFGKRLEEETKSRKKLENLIRRSVPGLPNDTTTSATSASPPSMPVINDLRPSPSEC